MTIRMYIGHQKRAVDIGEYVVKQYESSIAPPDADGCRLWQGTLLNGLPGFWHNFSWISATRLAVVLHAGDDVTVGRRVATCKRSKLCVNVDHTGFKFDRPAYDGPTAETQRGEGPLRTPPMLDALARAQGMDVPFERVPIYGGRGERVCGLVTTREGQHAVDEPCVVVLESERLEQMRTKFRVAGPSAMYHFIDDNVTMQAKFPGGGVMLAGLHGRVFGANLADAVVRSALLLEAFNNEAKQR